MTATIKITPDSNVDYSRMRVIDHKDVRDVKFDWEDTVTVYDTVDDETCEVKIKNISLFDHRLMLDGVKHKCLHMFSK